MATYGRKFSIALFASFMLTLSSFHQQVACKDEGKLLQQREALYRFFKSVKSKNVSWDTNTPVCNWKGVTCHQNKEYVLGLWLPGKSILGQIPKNTIGNITTLTKLCLSHNGLTGPIPSDFSKLENLVQFELQHNKFSGQLPNLTFKRINKTLFNVSFNNLDGYIPASLSSLDKSSFDQNIDLCGPPLARECRFPIPTQQSIPQTASPPQKKPTNRLSQGAIAGIAVGSSLVVYVILLSTVQDNPYMNPCRLQLSLNLCSSKDQERSKLESFKDGNYTFGVKELLQASREVLGKGRTGTTYKTLMKERAVVVKRLKNVVVTKEDFESQMEILGKMKNENVVPLKAYHWSKKEKLLVYDHFPAGSVYDLLHGSRGAGSRGSGPIHPNWEERMGIALSAAKGLAYLHVSGNLVHGNFKSSNILLRKETSKEALVSDYGLNILFEGSNSPTLTMKSDVYSFGIFLLELLTRKVPKQTSSGKEGYDLPQLILSVPQEEWKTKVFDMELIRNQNSNVEEEMVRLMEIAMRCVSLMPNQQPTMGDVVRMMEDMNRDTLH